MSRVLISSSSLLRSWLIFSGENDEEEEVEDRVGARDGLLLGSTVFTRLSELENEGLLLFRFVLPSLLYFDSSVILVLRR